MEFEKQMEKDVSVLKNLKFKKDVEYGSELFGTCGNFFKIVDRYTEKNFIAKELIKSLPKEISYFNEKMEYADYVMDNKEEFENGFFEIKQRKPETKSLCEQLEKRFPDMIKKLESWKKSAERGVFRANKQLSWWSKYKFKDYGDFLSAGEDVTEIIKRWLMDCKESKTGSFYDGLSKEDFTDLYKKARKMYNTLDKSYDEYRDGDLSDQDIHDQVAKQFLIFLNELLGKFKGKNLKDNPPLHPIQKAVTSFQKQLKTLPIIEEDEDE